MYTIVKTKSRFFINEAHQDILLSLEPPAVLVDMVTRTTCPPVAGLPKYDGRLEDWNNGQKVDIDPIVSA